MANKKGSRQLTWTDRISIEALKKAGHSVIEIAEQLGVHRSTIYNELKRGEYIHRNSDYTETLSYSPNKAQMKAEENLKARGTQLKIGNDIAYANYIEDKIVNEDYSPAAVLGELKAQGKEGDFSVTVCVTTLYSYIDKGIFLKLSNKNLPVKKNKKRNYKKVQRQQKRAAAGESIDKRPKEIDTREEFGNWEMDSVLGKRGKSKNTLLVLTERKTRNEIIFKLSDHTDEAVVAALDRLERKWGADMFKRVFKTITVDNGSEFADAEVTNKDKQTGALAEIMKGKDVFIGVSAPNIVTAEMVASMANDPIVFAMANPTPEIMPEEAKKGGVRVMATGRSDYPNQINNVLVFPGIFRGALDAKAKAITEEMKIAAAKAIASIVTDEELNEEYIIPGAFDERVAKVVAKAVSDEAKKLGIVKE